MGAHHDGLGWNIEVSPGLALALTPELHPRHVRVLELGVPVADVADPGSELDRVTEPSIHLEVVPG